jgi:hypothetical protein
MLLARWLLTTNPVIASQPSIGHSSFQLKVASRSAHPVCEQVLSLLSNAVLVWNTVHIDRIVTQLRADGNIILDTDLARTLPLLRAHISPNGSYFQSSRKVPA